jgi:hypothetical protein
MSQIFLGMDFGDTDNQICILDLEGTVVESTGVSNRIDEIKVLGLKLTHKDTISYNTFQ